MSYIETILILKLKLKLFSRKGKIEVGNFPADIYMFKVKNKKTRTRSEICLNLTIEAPEQGMKYVQSLQ